MGTGARNIYKAVNTMYLYVTVTMVTSHIGKIQLKIHQSQPKVYTLF